jgi:multidrug efflux pump subunit AcrB
VSRIISWFVYNPVAANLLMLVLIVGGLVSLPMIRQEEFPAIDLDIVRISVEYPGATPEESEQSVCLRIEEAIEGTPDVDRMTTVAAEGVCVVTVELVIGGDADIALSEIDNRVQGIDTFPEETERPVVSKLLSRGMALQFAIAGDADERTLKVLGQRARDEIAALPGVSQVNLDFARPYEISIEVPEDTLRRHGLSLDDVASAVRRASLDLPGGSVKTTGGEILLRSVGQAYSAEEFAEIAVLTRQDGTSVHLDEIATIVDGFEDIDLRARFNGKPAVIILVESIGEEDILEVAGTVKPWLKEFRKTLPEGIEATVFADASQNLDARLSAMTRNARSGLVLVVAILALFLRFRLAMWVAAGVPISLLGAIALFPMFGVTISTLTAMAFILVIGILVDDAIVIGEAVHSHEGGSETQAEAAINGTLEVYIPVFFGVMTTIAAFIPLIIVPGRMGDFFGWLGLTAILCLVFSLIESQLILPSHLAHRRTDSKKAKANRFVGSWQRFQSTMANGLERIGRVHYGRALDVAIEWRYVTVAIALGVVLLTVTLFASGRMRYQFVPAVEGDIVTAFLTMPQGIPIDQTQAAIEQIQAAVDEIEREFETEYPDVPIIQQTVATIGSQLNMNGGPQDMAVNIGGAHLASFILQLSPAAERPVGAVEVTRRMREKVGAIPDAVELAFSSDTFSAGEPLNFQLSGSSVEQLTLAAAELRAKLATFRGVTDIADSFRAGKQEVQLSLRDEARPLGLSQIDLARQVRQAFYGEEVQRIQRGRDDVKVMVRYPVVERRSLGSLEEMRIRTHERVEVPFDAVAHASLDRGFATVRRTDRERVVQVTGDVDRAIVTPEKVIGEVRLWLPEMLERYPGVAYELDGEQREQARALGGLARGVVIALLLIYVLLAVPLKSYVQPLVIMSVIPFGAVGAILGHLLMGWDVVFFSILGIVALSGVVVNASLVLVHYINGQRDKGVPLLESVRLAGIVRFRPIVLTSMTTFIGLVPLMFEGAVAARPLVPMAIALGYGVLCAATVTLFLVPAGYVILADLNPGMHAEGRRGQDAPATPDATRERVA